MEDRFIPRAIVVSLATIGLSTIISATLLVMTHNTVPDPFWVGLGGCVTGLSALLTRLDFGSVRVAHADQVGPNE